MRCKMMGLSPVLMAARQHPLRGIIPVLMNAPVPVSKSVNGSALERLSWFRMAKRS